MKVSEVSNKVSSFKLLVQSSTEPEFIDITDEVQEHVNQSAIDNGLCLVFSRHTTAAITIQENEPLLIEDFCNMLEKASPKQGQYQHNDFSVRTVNMNEDECPNGHSHCRQIILGSSETIPLIDGKLALGKWQSIFMIELDQEAPQPREIIIQIVGN